MRSLTIRLTALVGLAASSTALAQTPPGDIFNATVLPGVVQTPETRELRIIRRLVDRVGIVGFSSLNRRFRDQRDDGANNFGVRLELDQQQAGGHAVAASDGAADPG